jgi:hypothetical protein
LFLSDLWPTDAYLYSQSCQIYRLGPNLFISIDWFPYIKTVTQLYSALSQDGKLVVEDIPLVVWGLCFGSGWSYILPFWGVSLPVSASSIYAAIVCVSGG